MVAEKELEARAREVGLLREPRVMHLQRALKGGGGGRGFLPRGFAKFCIGFLRAEPRCNGCCRAWSRFN